MAASLMSVFELLSGTLDYNLAVNRYRGIAEFTL